MSLPPVADPLIYRYRSLTICLNIPFDKFAVKSTRRAINSRWSRPRSNHSAALPEEMPSGAPSNIDTFSINSHYERPSPPKWRPEFLETLLSIAVCSERNTLRHSHDISGGGRGEGERKCGLNMAVWVKRKEEGKGNDLHSTVGGDASRSNPENNRRSSFTARSPLYAYSSPNHDGRHCYAVFITDAISL